jgi:hypothetical protein
MRIATIALALQNLELIDINFKKCINGFHLINSCNINETIWEELNSLIFTKSGIEVTSKSDGNHLSGMDIQCSLGGISNKSAKYSLHKRSIDVSSYRLTTVCNSKYVGTISEIVEEINQRKNFGYYSIIVREEMEGQNHYDWLFIPSDYYLLDPSSYEWYPMIGKKGKNKDLQVGWNTNEINGCKMSIKFSMSSQLWIYLEMTEELRQFIVASSEVSTQPKYNYIDLLDNLA